MIELVDNGQGEVCPAFLCRTCSKEVHGPNAGMVLWTAAGSSAFVVHKGTCDTAADPQDELLSMELEEFVELLHANALRPVPTGATAGQ